MMFPGDLHPSRMIFSRKKKKLQSRKTLQRGESAVCGRESRVSGVEAIRTSDIKT